jgi:DNA-binding NtrC family response regulator
MVTRGEINPSSLVHVIPGEDGENLVIREIGQSAPTAARPSILIVDDNHDLLNFLAIELKEAGWTLSTAENAEQARLLFHELRPGAVLLDYLLGEDDGLKLGLEFQARAPETKVVIMTGGGLSEEEITVCAERNFPILLKPFLSQDVLNLIREPYRKIFAASAGSSNLVELKTRADSV